LVWFEISICQIINGYLYLLFSLLFILWSIIHRKKRFTSFPSPAGMSLTKLPLGRNNSVMTSLFPPKFGSDIPAGDGKLANFFFTVYAKLMGCLNLFFPLSKSNRLLKNFYPTCRSKIFSFLLYIIYYRI
jgi:hypothetical protein